MPSLRSRLVSAKVRSTLRMSQSPLSAVSSWTIDLRLGGRDRRRDGFRIERVGDRRLGAERAHRVRFGGAPGHPGDLVPALDQTRDQSATEGSGCAGKEDLHLNCAPFLAVRKL